jgi:hypothetical protein
MPGGASVSKTLLAYLKAHQGTAKYLVAAVGSSTAGELALQSGRNVVNMGGFMGSDPAPSLSKLKSLVSSGQLRYVLLSSNGGQGGPGGGGPSGSSTATQARDAWIKAHGVVVKLTDSSTGSTLYDLSGAA